MRTCMKMAPIRPRPSSRNDQNRVVLNRAICRSTSAMSPATRKVIGAVSLGVCVGRRKLDAPRHDAQMLVVRARALAPGQRALRA